MTVAEKPVHKNPSSTIIQPANNGDNEYPLATAARVVSRFDIKPPVEVYDFNQKGNINRHTYLVKAGSGETQQYLLQQINQQVFVRPDNVMTAMIAAIDAQNANKPKLPQDIAGNWEAITLVPVKEGAQYLRLTDRHGITYWRLMVKIPNTSTYKSLSEIDNHDQRMNIAFEVGRGLALFLDLTSTIDTTLLTNPLPGYRDTQLYYDQFLSVLAGNRTFDQAKSHIPDDEILRNSTGSHFLVHCSEETYRNRMDDPELKDFIKLALDERQFGLKIANEMKQGTVRTVAIHGDTKLENFLFNPANNKVKAVVDLDTIMPHTWLTDWGDMARSMVNIAGEKAQDLSGVQVNMEIYEALAKGFLSATEASDHEIGLMVDAVQIIALELGIRFLADYLRGDTYFQLGPADSPDLNKTRAMVQLTLFQQLRKREDECASIISSARKGT